MNKEERTWHVYRHIRLDTNEPFYIGIGINKGKYNHVKSRANSKHDRNKYWKNIVNQCEYKIDILFDELNVDDAIKKEVEFIQLYGRKDLGLGALVNMTDGGEGQSNISEKVRKAASKRMVKMNKEKIWTDEERSKVSKATKGKRKSDETRQKMSESSKGRALSQETKDKIADNANERFKDPKNREIYRQGALKRFENDANKDYLRKPRSKEIKEKLSKAHKNKKVSDETRNKISESLKKLYKSEKGDSIKKKISPKGRIRSEESKKKQSESMKIAWARRKAKNADK